MKNMDNVIDQEIDLDAIDACRACGIYYLKTVNFLRDLFSAPVDDPQMHQIRMELASWKLEVTKDDERPQNICMGCINEFKRIFKFRESCLEAQKQFEFFECQQRINKSQIKTEIPDPNEQNFCGFIYIDDLSDTENDGEYDDSPVHGFDMPHLPIKEEHFEGAKIPNEVNNMPPSITQAPVCPDLLLPAKVKNEIKTELMEEIKLPSSLVGKEKVYYNLTNLSADEDDDVQIVKFTYDDDDNDTVEEIETIQNESSFNSEAEYICKLCLHVAKDQESLRLHVQRIHDVKDLECHICGKIFKNSTASRLKFHIKWHKLSKHIKCAQCGFYCTSRDILNEHTRAIHSKIKCNICGKKMLAKRLKAHLREHDYVPMTMYPCSLCTNVFDNQLSYETHVSNAHNTAQANTDVTKNKTVYENIATQLHSTLSGTTSADDTLNVTNLFDASHIGHEVTQNSTLNLDTTDDSQPSSHLNALTINDNHIEATQSDVSEAKDSICSNAVATSEQLNAHSDFHEHNNTKCHICGKTFDLTFKLNRHMQKHTKAPI